jgi:iron complex transport system ATP-binding protein
MNNLRGSSGRDRSVDLCEVTVMRGQRTVLDRLSLATHPKELWAVVGPNGAGKSTLLEVLVGHCPPASGEIRLKGRTLRALGPEGRARALALVGREVGHDLPLTVRHLVELGRLPYVGRWGGMGGRDLAVVERALRTTGCTELAGRTLSSLSDGERQRVHFARALAQEPQVLLMDEATAHLDLEHRHDTLRRVREFTKIGGSALVVVHDLELAVRHATHVAVLSGGRLFARGVPSEVLTAQLLEQVFRVRAELVSLDGGHFLHVFGPVTSAPTRERPPIP